MALGVARCLGINLTRNFAYPYFSRDIAEFWRRWHTSLSSWFRDYVFFPLGANYRGTTRWALNIMMTFAACGLWHGPRWTFVAWGALVGLYFLPLIARKPVGKRPSIVARGRRWPTPAEASRVAGTFALVTFAWIPFRAESAGAAVGYISGMLLRTWTAYPLLSGLAKERGVGFAIIAPAILAVAVFVVEWFQRERAHGLAIEWAPSWLQWSAYYILIAVLLTFAPAQPVQFLYADF
jgi:D-alanyl-lipoteichoic acid acyltransferase DltB (MBOAT superfamily)